MKIGGYLVAGPGLGGTPMLHGGLRLPIVNLQGPDHNFCGIFQKLISIFRACLLLFSLCLMLML